MSSKTNSSRVRRTAGRSANRRALDVLAQEAKLERMLVPPPLPPVGRFSTSVRYQPATAVSCTFTVACALALMAYTKTTTTAETAIESVKLRKLHVWVPGFVVTSSTAVIHPVCDVSIRDFVVPGLGVEREFQVIPNGGKGAYFCYKFRGFAREWFNAVASGSFDGSEVIFALLPANCIPMVQLDFSVQLPQATLMSSAASLTFQLTVDTTTAGAFYYPALDSLTSTSTDGNNSYPPIALQTITTNFPSPKPVLSGLLSTPLPVLSSSSATPHKCASACACHQH